jgi:chemotaxis protein MotA
VDLGTIIGVALGTLLLLAAILTGGSMTLFFDVPAALIVLGGTIGATLIRNPLSAVLGTFGVVRKAFTTRLPDAGGLIQQVVQMSRKARKESLLSLEKSRIEYPFLSRGVSLCVDGLEPGQIRAILEAEIASTAARHKRGQDILEGIGVSGPAFGMIGTLIGLVQMFAGMNDPSSIGPGMAIALLTTLYGAVLAYLVALPLADKLKVRSQEELLNMTLCLEGVLGLVQGEHPASIDERLKAFIAPKLRGAGREREDGEAARAAA